MKAWEGWSDSAADTVRWLGDARSRRLKRGRRDNAQIRSRMAAAKAGGEERHAEHISLQLHKKSIAFTRRQRLREIEERERDLKRVGAAIRRTVRELERVKNSPTAPLFEFEPRRTGTKLRDARDLYWEWVPRGFSKGQPKNYSKSGSPRIRAREARWQDGEFEDKIVYIEREEALEQVAGNLVSNMGRDQAERLGCASRIEELERLSRSNAGVYTHSILALPADLSPEGRAEVLKEICSHYGRLGLPHCGALHKPDPANSQKNFHAHILVALRPMERVGDQWRFAASKLSWLSTPAGLKLQRRIIAGVFNTALQREKSRTTFTARSRAADGLPPGGFTKRGGVGRPPPSTRDLDDALHARTSLAEAEELDGAIAALERIAERLETCDQGLQALRATTVRQAPPQLAGRDEPPSVPEEREEPVVAPSFREDPASERFVASPQQADGIERELRPRSVHEEEEDCSLPIDPPLPQDVTPPLLMGDMDDDERERRRKLRKAREALFQEETYRDLAEPERRDLLGRLDALTEDLATGAAVISAKGELLSISAETEAQLALVRDVASSQQGWFALQKMAAAIAEFSPHPHAASELVSDPADAWPIGFALGGPGRGR